MPNEDRRRALVRQALRYPYEAPDRSFLLTAGRAHDLDTDGGALDPDARVAVLTYGSNASPPVLARKLGPSTEPVPVIRSVLRGFDIVYSAHVAPYGAVPATLCPSEGVELPVFIAHFTAAQLEAISATEPNYELAELPAANCHPDPGEASRSRRPPPPGQPAAEPAATHHRLVAGGETPAGLLVYLSRHGRLRLDGSSVALAAVEARGRRLPELSQRQVLERVRDIVRPGWGLERFIAACAIGEIPAEKARHNLPRVAAR